MCDLAKWSWCALFWAAITSPIHAALAPALVTPEQVASVLSAGAKSDLGTLAGVASVTPTGAAQYSVALPIPPGSGGFAPGLAAVYDGSGLQGSLGVGWKLSGLSTIARCAPNPSQDGVRAPLSASQADRLCLDGTRLVPLDGKYWGNATAYKLESELFARISRIESSGIEGYQVHWRDGSVSTYGGTADSLKKRQGVTAPLAWHISRVRDRFGNYYAIEYENDPTTGDVRPIQITYSGNTGANILPGVKLTFVYDAQPDAVVAYVLDTQFTINKRLVRIDVSVNGQLARKLKFDYRQSVSTSRSLLKSITYCAADDTQCIDPLAFEYWDAVRPVISAASSIGPDDGVSEIRGKKCKLQLPFDANFDGKGDVICVLDIPGAKAAAFASIYKDGKLTNWQRWGGGSQGNELTIEQCSQTSAGDFNGDGVPDLLCVIPSGNVSDVWIAVGGRNALSEWKKWGTVSTASGLTGKVECDAVYAQDIDGDGRSDIVCLQVEKNGEASYKTAVVYGLSDGGKFAAWTTLPSAVDGPNLATCKVGSSAGLFQFDLDGNGSPDLVCHSLVPTNCNGAMCIFPFAPTTWVSRWNGKTYSQWVNVPSGGLGSNPQYYGPCETTVATDVNGDGLTDILCLRSASRPNAPFVQFGTGTGLTAWQPLPEVPGNVNLNTCAAVSVLDLNGDGRADILCLRRLGSGFSASVAASTNSGFGGWRDLTAAITDGCEPTGAGDFSGAGVHNIACFIRNASGTLVTETIPIDIGRDFLSSVSNGHGRQVAFEYAGLGSVHRAAISTYPLQDLSTGPWVISAIATGDPVSSGERRTQYSYAGLKKSAATQEVVGFESIAAEDLAARKRVETFYIQAEPFLGAVRRTEVKIDSIVISASDNDWQLLAYTLYCESADKTGAVIWSPVTSDAQTSAERQAGCEKAATDGKQVRYYLKADRLNAQAAIAMGKRIETSLFPSYQRLVIGSVSESFDLAGKSLHKEVAKIKIDDYGNALWTEKVESDGRRALIESIFEVDMPAWQPGRVVSTKLSASLNSESRVRETSFGYDSSGVLIAETVGANSVVASRKQFERDLFGNVTRTTETTLGGLQRSTVNAFDTEGVYLATRVNAVGHKESFSFDRVSGLKTGRVDASGRTWNWSFDLAGRQVRETNPMGNSQDSRYVLCAKPNVVCPERAVRASVTSTPGSPTTITFFDSMERATQRVQSAFGGGWRASGTAYDDLGRVAKEYGFALAGELHPFRAYQYDLLERATRIDDESGLIRTVTFDGLVSEVRDAFGNAEKIEVNPRGQPVRRATASGKTVQTTFDVWGNPQSIAIGTAPAVTLAYDDLGRNVSSASPDRGTVVYRRDGFGRVIEEVRGTKRIEFAYDMLDRLVYRKDPEGVVKWFYDEDPKAKGLLSRVEGPGNAGEKYVYDVNGQLTAKTKIINGVPFVFRYVYDKNGLLTQTVFPDGFVLRHSFDQFGMMRNQRLDSGALLLEVTKVTAGGQVAEYLYGNAQRTTHEYDSGRRRVVAIQTTRGPNNETVYGVRYTYDAVGLVAQQDDLALNQTERFTYDAMRRLVVSDLLGGESITTEYDDFGRPTNKSNAGTISYEPSPLRYGPSRVGTQTLERDDEGRLTKWGAGAMVLGSHGKPLRISRGSYQVDSQYDHEYELVAQKVTYGAGTNVVGAYPLKPMGALTRVSGLFEVRRFEGRELTYHYLPGPTGLYGVVVFDKNLATKQTRRYVRYFHRDRVGSVVAVSSETGELVERRRYDAWGGRREISQAGVITAPFIPIDQSFAGHTAMRDFGLIYAGGRLYDPSTGLFTAPDPLAALGSAFHEYNAYGYGAFNPLSAVDPYGLISFGEVLGGIAGFVVGGPFGAVMGVAVAHEAERNEALRTAVTIGVAVVITVGTGGGGASVGAAMLTGMAAGAGAAATYTALSGGNFEQVISAATVGAVVGGFTGAAGYGVTQGALYVGGTSESLTAASIRVAGQSVIGGMTNEALGGDFKHGFEQAAFFASLSEAGSAMYRKTMVRNADQSMPDDFDTYKDGRPHLSDVSSKPADPGKFAGPNAPGNAAVAMEGDRPCYRCNNWGAGPGEPIPEGGAASRLISKIPGQNPAAYIHDSWMAKYGDAAGLWLPSSWQNRWVASMLPAGILTYSAMAHEMYTIKNQAIWGCRSGGRTSSAGELTC